MTNINLTHTPAYTTHHPDTFTVANTGLTLTVRHDEDATDPREWFHVDHVALFIFRANTSNYITEYAPDNDVAREFERVFDLTRDTEAALDAAKAVANDDFWVDVISLNGYTQGDWADVFVAVRKGIGSLTTEDVVEVFRQWLYGDVYVVGAEDNGYAVSGIYADDMEDAARQYLNYYRA